MNVIDADTHVDETEDTWEYIEADQQSLRPVTGYPPNSDPTRPPTRYWMIDGRRQMRFTRDDARSQTTVGMRELMDVPARLQAMDAMGVEAQVMYPTLFLVESTERPEVELAVRRSYNRWLGDRYAESGGRLRWVCLPPTRSMDKAVEEVRWAKEHGACGVLKKGNQEADKWPTDEYFYPLYEEAERLNMPICFHTGSGVPDYSPVREFNLSSFLRMQMSVPNAFQALVTQGVTKRFPTLRFGFIEAGASWIPFLDYEMKRRIKKLGAGSTFGRTSYDVAENFLEANRFWVTCQVDEDLPYILKYAGEDHLMIGSDFVHADASSERDYYQRLRDRVDAGEISEGFLQKLVWNNPRTFYGL